MKYTDELYNEENTLLSNDLETKYSESGEHPIYTRQLWREEVLNENVLSGYWDWVFNSIQGWEPDQDDADLEAAYREAAHERYANDECEFDDNCAVSLGDDDGAWVSCWRWVPKSVLP